MPEYVTEKPTTVCVECKHHRSLTMEGTETTEAWVWYDQYCYHAPAEYHYSIFTGERQERKRVPCHLVNTGNCPHFEAKEK